MSVVNAFEEQITFAISETLSYTDNNVLCLATLGNVTQTELALSSLGKFSTHSKRMTSLPVYKKLGNPPPPKKNSELLFFAQISGRKSAELKETNLVEEVL